MIKNHLIIFKHDILYQLITHYFFSELYILNLMKDKFFFMKERERMHFIKDLTHHNGANSNNNNNTNRNNHESHKYINRQVKPAKVNKQTCLMEKRARAREKSLKV